MAGAFVCVDFGSTYTKALLVDEAGWVRAKASHRTTVETDVMDGYDACLAALAAAEPSARAAEVRACSSAGGGLRIVVVGQEELVSAEAGRRVALSSGGVVVGVLGRPHEQATYDALLLAARPDVVLLTGGTDGGNRSGLVDGARMVAAGDWTGAVVVAGNVDARDEAGAILEAAGHPVVLADNVLPRIGALEPGGARRAIREMFLAHVIGGKHLSARGGFLPMVRGATPDVVLTGVEVLAEAAGLRTGVAVVDVGGATTDVHSVVRLDAETAELGREVVAATPVTRTVEGDLGMRWSAASTARAAVAAGLADASLVAAGDRRAADPAYLPEDDEGALDEERIATAAVTLAVRRHVGRSQVVVSPEGRVVERTGKDLREVDLLVGSGGVLRNAAPATAYRILAAATGATPEGWQQPEAPQLVVDVDSVLAAVGLLAADHPQAAVRLARSVLSRTVALGS